MTWLVWLFRHPEIVPYVYLGLAAVAMVCRFLTLLMEAHDGYRKLKRLDDQIKALGEDDR